jgi:hypothetical protein
MPIKEMIEAKVKLIIPDGSHPNDVIEPDKLEENQIFALLAWEMWKDGLDDEAELSALYNGFNELYNTKEKAWHTLRMCFGY